MSDPAAGERCASTLAKFVDPSKQEWFVGVTDDPDTTLRRHGVSLASDRCHIEACEEEAAARATLRHLVRLGCLPTCGRLEGRVVYVYRIAPWTVEDIDA